MSVKWKEIGTAINFRLWGWKCKDWACLQNNYTKKKYIWDIILYVFVQILYLKVNIYLLLIACLSCICNLVASILLNTVNDNYGGMGWGQKLDIKTVPGPWLQCQHCVRNFSVMPQVRSSTLKPAFMSMSKPTPPTRKVWREQCVWVESVKLHRCRLYRADDLSWIHDVMWTLHWQITQFK